MVELRTLLLAVLGGLIGYLSGMPGGPLVGALVAVAVASRAWAARIPRPITLSAQLMIGSAAGALVTRATLIELWIPLLFGLGFSVAVLVIAVACGLVLSRITDLDRLSAILCFVPGGLSEIAVFADDYDVRTEVVIAVHLVRRLVTVGLVVVIAAWSLR